MLDYGQPYRPYGKSVLWSTRLPDNAAIDPISPSAVAQLAVQAKIASPAVNVNSWTLEPLAVPASQPLVPVGWTRTDGQFEQLRKVFALGVPIPPGWTPTSDFDASGSFWQPDYVHPVTGYQGRIYELYGVKQVGGQWAAYLGTRQYNVNAPNAIRQYSAQSYTDYATNPDSLYSDPAWGVQGSGIPYAPGVLTKADCDRGYVDHPLLLEVVHARAGGFVWPAKKDDGDDHSTAQLVREGQRYRFAPGYAIDPTWPYLLQLIVQAGRDFGFIVTDRGSCLAFRAAPSAASYLNGVAYWQILTRMPWADLQLQAVGSDTTPTPTV